MIYRDRERLSLESVPRVVNITYIRQLRALFAVIAKMALLGLAPGLQSDRRFAEIRTFGTGSTYLARLETADFVTVQKMALLK